MMDNIQFVVELMDKIDGLRTTILCKANDLADFLKNYDTEKYQLINVYGMGEVFLDYKDFIKKNNDLETGEGEQKC